MRKIFIGFLLIYLDFSINLGASKIGLIPDFIGYIVMLNGLQEMAAESPIFSKVKPFAALMAVYTGIIYLLDLFGISASLGAVSIILGIVSAIISLYISYTIVMAVKDMENKYNAPLNGASLKSTWTILAVFTILNFVLLFLPSLLLVSIIVSIIIAICFLVSFNTSKNMYYNMTSRY